MQKNGKYIFAANNNGTKVLPDPNSGTIHISKETGAMVYSQTYYNGNIILEVIYLSTAPATQRLSTRFYFNPLDFNAKNTESFSNNFVVRYFTKLTVPTRTFFTDSSGLEEVRRPFPLPGMPIHKFYYPITKFVYVEGKESAGDKSRVSIVVDRPEGCTMPAEGVIEVMLHRASIHDDEREINENELEPYTASILHYILSENISQQDRRLYRQLQVIEDSQPVIMFVGEVCTTEVPLIYPNAPTFGSLEKVSPYLRVSFAAFDGSDNTMVRIYNMHPSQGLELDPVKLLRERFGIKVYTLQERSIDYILPKTKLNDLPDRFNKEKRFPVYQGTNNIKSGDGMSGGGGEKILLRPLELRAFRIIGPNV
jgi:hypothetical protein